MSVKLGEVITFTLKRGIARFIVTGIYPAGPHRSWGFHVLTPIPEGEDETGLGRTYFAAEIINDDVPMDEKHWEFKA